MLISDCNNATDDVIIRQSSILIFLKISNYLKKSK